MNFPMLKNRELIYLDSAATTLKPQCVIDAINDFYSRDYGTVHRAIYGLAVEATEKYEAVRTKVQTFLNAKSGEEIVFTKGTTESINLVAHSFGKAFIQAGDEVLIPEIEHHSNLVPWQIMCEERGAHLKFIPVNDKGELIDFEKHLSSKTKLIALAHVSNSLGVIHPIKKITELAHKAGAKVLVDGAQSAPHMPIDVQALDVDFFAFSGHKCYGPTGVGILYGKYELLEQLPPYQTGGHMIEKVTCSGTTFQKPPLRFEAGTPMIAQVLGLGAAIDFLQEIGMEAIQEREKKLHAYALEKMQKIEGIHIVGEPKSTLISFVAEGVHPLDLGTFLDLKKIAIRTGHQCSQTAMERFKVSSLCRISFGVYNTQEDIDRFVELLEETRCALIG